MDINDVTAPVEEQEVATEEVIEPDEMIESEADDADDDQDPDLDEIDFEGSRYKVPKALVPAIMKNQDYTQKTQTLAEERREFEEAVNSSREAFEQEQQLASELIEENAGDRALHARIEYLKTVNPNMLSQEEAQRYWNEFNMLRAAKDETATRIDQRKAELTELRERDDATAILQVKKALQQPDERLGWPGGYDDATDVRLGGVAKELGLSQQDVKTLIRNPAFPKALNLIAIGLETLKKQRAIFKTPARPDAKPVPQVGASRVKGVVNMDSLSADEWRVARNKQIAARKR